MAHPQYIGSFPSYSANSSKQLPIAGIAPVHEVQALVVDIEGTLASTATAFTPAAADYDTLMAALISKIRLTVNGVTDAVSLTPKELRALTIDFLGRDLAGQDGFVWGSTQCPASGAPRATKLYLYVPFKHVRLENPTIFAYSSDQLNIPGNHLDIDTGTGASALAITGGSVNFVVNDIKVLALTKRVDAPYVASTVLMRNKAIAQSIDTESGAGLDLLLADERTPATTTGQVAQLTLVRDGISNPRNVAPDVLAACYEMSAGPFDGNFPLKFTSYFSPILWVTNARDAEKEWNVFFDHRQIQQNLASGGSAAATYLFAQVRPIEQVENVIAAVSRQYGVQTAPGNLPIRGGGGGDNGVGARFKPRWISNSNQ